MEAMEEGRFSSVASSSEKEKLHGKEDEAATQVQRTAQFIGGGHVPPNGIPERTPFALQAFVVKERLPIETISQRQPRLQPQQPQPQLFPTRTIKQRSHHRELVEKHKKKSDTHKGGQFPKRSSLATEKPPSDHELARVQRSNLRNKQKAAQLPPVMRRKISSASHRNRRINASKDQNHSNAFDDSRPAPSSSSPSSSSGIGSLAVANDTPRNTDTNANLITMPYGPGVSRVGIMPPSSELPASGTEFVFLGPPAERLYPVSGGIPGIQQSNHQGHQQTHSSYPKPSVQALYPSPSSPMWAVSSNPPENWIPFIFELELVPHAEHDSCGACIEIRMGKHCDDNHLQTTSPPYPSSSPSPSTPEVLSLQFDMILDEMLFSYVDNKYKPQPIQAYLAQYYSSLLSEWIPSPLWQRSATGTHNPATHSQQWGPGQQY